MYDSNNNKLYYIFTLNLNEIDHLVNIIDLALSARNFSKTSINYVNWKYLDICSCICHRECFKSDLEPNLPKNIFCFHVKGPGTRIKILRNHFFLKKLSGISHSQISWMGLIRLIFTKLFLGKSLIWS